MARQEDSGTPFPYKLRSLRTVKGARIELARLYREVKSGEIDPTIAARCTAILSALIGSYRDHEVETRLDEIDAKLAQARSSGHDREVRP